MEFIKKDDDNYIVNVSDLCLSIYKFIHVTNLTDKIKTLSKEERFFLCNYVIETYGNSESKETDSLIENLTELEKEVDLLIQHEDSKLEDEFYLNLVDLIKPLDITLSSVKLDIDEISKEEAIVLLRDEKLDQLFGS
jgi:homoaconitase/3-isopropylmalate dehydratase large subunit